MNTRKKVLVIDDDEDFGLALTFLFEDKPFHLLLAHTLSVGMTMLEKERPENIFLDNGLPDGFGWEKAEYIMGHYPGVRLILISALRMPRPSVSVHRILQKPISLDDMMACLE
jgi:DNA-binding response OmpR family regulator